MTKVYYIEPQHFDEAAANGIKPDRVRERVYKLGWDIEDAITTPIRPMNDPWRKQAKENGINRSTYAYRVEQGMSPEEAATMPPRTSAESVACMNKAKKRTFTDEQLAIAAANGIDKRTLYNRVGRSKWSKEKAITTPVSSIRQTAAAHRWRQEIAGECRRQNA